MKVPLFIVGLFLMLNCKDPINIEGDGNIGSLVVQGKITTLPGPYEMRLGRTVGIDQKPSPVSSAIVTIFDDAGNSETYSEITPGIYSIPGAIVQGTAGYTYHIEITLEDGRKYSSKPETIPDDTGIATPSYSYGSRSVFEGEVESKINVVNVYAETDLPVSDKVLYFRWDVGEAYMFEQSPEFDPFTGTIPKPCYVSGDADPQRISLYNTKNQKVTKKGRTLVAVRDIDYSFLSKHYFAIYVNSITTAAYTYWQHVDQLINRSGSIFDTPPAPIKGNIFSETDEDEVVYGYFESANTSMVRISMLRGDVPFALFPYCNDPTYGPYWTGYPQPCKNCLLLDNSTKTPPDWWLEDN
jgi:hypothetical protein